MADTFTVPRDTSATLADEFHELASQFRRTTANGDAAGMKLVERLGQKAGRLLRRAMDAGLPLPLDAVNWPAVSLDPTSGGRSWYAAWVRACQILPLLLPDRLPQGIGGFSGDVWENGRVIQAARQPSADQWQMVAQDFADVCEVLANSLPDDGQNETDGAAATKPKRPGRKPADCDTRQREREICIAWQSARERGMYKVDFARQNGLTGKKFNELLDRERQRRKRRKRARG